MATKTNGLRQLAELVHHSKWVRTADDLTTCILQLLHMTALRDAMSAAYHHVTRSGSSCT